VEAADGGDRGDSFKSRRIDTVSDVLTVLDGRYSFSEALDCVAVSEAAENWQLVERAALAALDAVDAGAKSPETLSEAAWQFVRQKLRTTGGLTSLERALPVVSEELDRLASKSGRNQRLALSSVRSGVNDLALLLADASPTSYVKLCSLLRKRIRRPELGIIAATRALNPDAANAAALNTRGAARLDLEQLTKAADDLERAWAIEKSHYVANTHVRLFMLRSEHTEAVRWSVVAVDAAPPGDTVALKVMAAAALAADDQAQLQEAIATLRAHEKHDSEQPDRWVLLLAARQFMRDGLLDLARATLDDLLDLGTYGPATKLNEELNRELKRRQPPN